MPSRLSSSLRSLLVLLLLVPITWLAGCSEPEPELSGDQLRPVPALRFAGSDMMYALRRVAEEADLPLVLEDVRTRDNSPDLGIYRIDIDLPAGPVFDALRTLQKETGAFDFRVQDGVIWVRSALTLTEATVLDEAFISPREFEGDIEDVIDTIMKERQFTFLRLLPIVGEKEPPVVKLSIEEPISPVAFLVEYARQARMGWWMRRAGYLQKEEKDKKTVVGTSVTPWSLPPTRHPIGTKWGTLLSALADVSARTDTPMLVLDRSVLQQYRGALSYTGLIDTGLPFEEMMKQLEYVRDDRLLRWERAEGDVVIVRSNYFLGKLSERGFLREPLKGGTFAGTLPELARFINGNYQEPDERYLMAGEIRGDLPSVEIEIPEGATPVDALLLYTRQSRDSVYLVVLDLTDPMGGEQIQHPAAWRGAYLGRLVEYQKGMMDHIPEGPAGP